MSVKLSVDIGGTFTDVVLARDTGLVTTKVLTTHAAPAEGVMQGIAEVLQRGHTNAEEVSLVLHGTTLATNALIERRGARTALLTTQGHRDVLEMAFENRFEQYDIQMQRAAPLVPRRLRIGIPERMSAQGSALLSLQPETLEEVLEPVVQQLRHEGVQAVAIGFLHSYANPLHERLVADHLRQVLPEIAVSLSSEVCPEVREYERFSTTVANAYVQPLMAGYLQELSQQLLEVGVGAQVLMMTSGGGLTSLSTAAQYPIRLVESGPAGGAILAARVAGVHDLNSVLSFDMGGTTAKICLIDEQQPLQSRAFEVDRQYRFKKGSGLPVRIPVIEMVEIGAGGGSLISLDTLKRVTVGPQSAGSEPGPASYGRGGQQPAVTDANLMMGRIQGNLFAGGRMPLDKTLAETAFTKVLSDGAFDPEQGAHAAIEIVEENMAAAARAHAAEWGKSLEQRTMVAFGGGAPLHAATLANKLKIDNVVIPAGAGVGSAIGFLLAPIRFEVVRSKVQLLAQVQQAQVLELLSDMRREAAAVLASAGLEAQQETCQVFMRYCGQGYEVAVSVAPQALDQKALQNAFEQAYAAIYGRTVPGMDIEILSWTLALSCPQEQSVEVTATSGQVEESRLETASSVRLNVDGEWQQALLVQRRDMEPALPYPGPALIVEEQTTTYLPPEMSAKLDTNGDLVLSRVFADDAVTGNRGG